MSAVQKEIDREKVIKGLEMARKLAWNGEHCNIMDADDALTVSYAITDALALLKAQEAIEARLNLCESCTKEYPKCDAAINGIEFGCGVGNDNIIGCTAYVNRWKAQAPVKPKIVRNIGFWCECGFYLGLNGGVNYCAMCGRAVKWE